ncbi:MAG: DegQ family serine endoprotease [Polaromonas sp.]|uniref:DegQ family serine endoprotease n=1 Tax=Polaromonas sp. TaxID=1869339 RepID=UPI00185ACBDD|nr:DegQ family serine endoprotease [Polaromonas sp.]NMM10116.1 DegQ family serine endoprotease [Polaromonas sp.]
MKSAALRNTRLVVALLTAGAIGGAGVGAFNAINSTATAAPPAAMVASGIPATPMALPDFSQITERYGPAVVNISVTGTTKVADDSPVARGDGEGMPNDPFFEFFRRFQQHQHPGGGPGEQGGQESTPTHVQGSGFIVSSDGIILTNAHVVRDAKEVTVKLTDRREFRAKVLGADPKTDIAVLRIDAKNLPVVALGKTSDLKVGEWVLAIGSPFGFENTVTAGVVSAKGRSLPDDSAVPFIQTDVPINPGNSGGPLFNTRGEVVGINSQIYSRSGGYQGLSFAIPIDVAAKIKNQIVATGKVEHARLGVAVQEVNQAFADSFKLDKPEGALVSTVEKGSPAEKAGLQSGDVIRKVNGQPIVSSGDLPALIGLATPGDTVKLDIWRQGSSKELTARLANADDKSVQVASKKDAPNQGKLGLALRPLQPDEKQEAGIDSGLLVQQATGPAALAGVQSGDVLISINGVPMKNLDQVRAAVAKSDKSVALLIQRGDSKIFVPVNLG